MGEEEVVVENRLEEALVGKVLGLGDGGGAGAAEIVDQADAAEKVEAWRGGCRRNKNIGWQGG